MKILITAKPRTGKSTLMSKVLSRIKVPTIAIITEEVIDDKGNRVGFKAKSENGEEILIAHISKIKSEIKVSSYFVDLSNLESFYLNQLDRIGKSPDSIIFIDEIGKMQSKSGRVLRGIEDIINNSRLNLIASIVYDDEPWSRKFKDNRNTMLIELTLGNRDDLVDALVGLCNVIRDIEQLPTLIKENFNSLLQKYFQNQHFISLHKLLNNALSYIISQSYRKVENSQREIHYFISGRTRDHNVFYDKNLKQFQCDCDLFLKTGKFTQIDQECSHVQVLRVLENIL